MKEETLRIIGTLCVIIAIATTIILVAGAICKIDTELLLLGVLLLISSIIGMLIVGWKLG